MFPHHHLRKAKAKRVRSSDRAQPRPPVCTACGLRRLGVQGGSGGASVRAAPPTGDGGSGSATAALGAASIHTVHSVPHSPSCHLRASLSLDGLSKSSFQQESRTSPRTALGCEGGNCQAFLGLGRVAGPGARLTHSVAPHRSQAQLRFGGRGLPGVCALEGLLRGPPGLWGECSPPRDSQKHGSRGHPDLLH